MTGYTEILYDVDDPSAVITFNRPDQMNGMTETMDREVKHAIAAAVADPRVVAIVLTGAGKGFCTGADMSLLAGSAAGDVDLEQLVQFPLTYSFLHAVPKPIISVVNGATAGMGLAIMTNSDLRFASDEASFTTVFARRGLIAEMGLSWSLPRLIGLGPALDLLLSSRKVAAPEALSLKLVDRVWPAAELLAQAKAYVKAMADSVAPRSMAVIKAQVYRDMTTSLDDAEKHAIARMYESFRQGDMKEGVSSFLERRPPAFARLRGALES